MDMDMDIVIKHYSGYDEDARLLSRHGQVEFLTTMRYVQRYLQSDMSILEIGAGTGRYSQTIADMGFKVDAVELSPKNIEVFKSKLKPNQNISISQGNALDLNMYHDNTFDMVLLLGPLYHLYTDADKRKSLSEALRVAKPGGIVFAAYIISDACFLEYFQTDVAGIKGYVDRGDVDISTFTVSKPLNVFEWVRKEDIERIMSVFEVEHLHYIAIDMISRLLRNELAAMDDEAFSLYLNYHYAVCERPDMVGITTHSLDVFRKPL